MEYIGKKQYFIWIFGKWTEKLSVIPQWSSLHFFPSIQESCLNSSILNVHRWTDLSKNRRKYCFQLLQGYQMISFWISLINSDQICWILVFAFPINTKCGIFWTEIVFRVDLMAFGKGWHTGAGGDNCRNKLWNFAS